MEKKMENLNVVKELKENIIFLVSNSSKWCYISGTTEDGDNFSYQGYLRKKSIQKFSEVLGIQPHILNGYEIGKVIKCLETGALISYKMEIELVEFYSFYNTIEDLY